MRTTHINLLIKAGLGLLFILFIGELSATNSVESQSKVDSLQLLIDTETVDTIKYKHYQRLVNELSQIDRNQAIPPLKQQLSLAYELEDPDRIANTAHTLSTQFLYLGQTDSAYVYELITKEYIDEVDDAIFVSTHLNSLALIYQRKNDYEEAIETYQQVIVLGDSIADYVGNVYTYINLMSLYMDLEDEEKALEYAEDIEEIKERFPTMSEPEVDEIQGLFSAIYLNVGLCHTILNELDTAEYYYNEAYRCLDYIKDDYLKTYYKGYIDNSLGDNYIKKHELDYLALEKTDFLQQALKFYQEAYTSFTKLSESRGISISLNKLGQTLNELKRPTEARTKLLSGLELAQSIDFREQIRDSYQHLAESAEQIGDYEGSTEYLKKWVTYKDSIRNEERDKITSEYEVKFESFQQQKEIEFLNAQNELNQQQQTIQRYIYGISLLLLLGAAYAYFARLRFRKQKEVADFQKEMNQAMSRFVPMGFIKALGKEKITDVKLGDQIETEVTVVFTDIRSFTTISEGMTPNENFAFVKEYAERMGPIIEHHGGFISQYLGDGIMAIFKNSSQDALNACIAMQEDIKFYNDLLVSRNTQPIKVGMGMHTGPLVMGIIGDESRWDATLISDTVNTAARIESSTKQFSSPILLSEYSVSQLNNKEYFRLTPMGELTVKGKTKPVAVYECNNT